MSGCNSRQPHQFLDSVHCERSKSAHQLWAESPKLSSLGAAPGDMPCSIHGVVADKKCTCPASKLMREHYPPSSTIHCGEDEIQASRISFASVGAPPRCKLFDCQVDPGCSACQPMRRKIYVGSRLIEAVRPSEFPLLSLLVAQSAERPADCGTGRGCQSLRGPHIRCKRRTRHSEQKV